MFIQPMVETADRRKLKLDDAIGPWFAIIGLNRDPGAALSAAERVAWTDLGAALVYVRKSRSEPLETLPENVIVLDDLVGGFRDYGFQFPKAEFVFLRPDRYVAAVCDATELNEVAAGLRALIQPKSVVAARIHTRVPEHA